MPLYEYICQDCQHPFEALVQPGETPTCPECSSTRLEKQFSVPGAPKLQTSSLPTSCGDPSLPPCGAPWCQRGKK
jgi:putative FmdB family regulatory protein